MQIVRAIGDVNVLDAADRRVYGLHRNEKYVLYDREVARGLQSGALELAETLGSRVQVYQGQPLTDERLIVPFIGRLGDALVTASCLHELHETYPGVSIDIACLPAAREVFELAPRVGRVIEYPLGVDSLEAYRFHLSFEDVESVRDGAGRSMADLFSACLKTPRPKRPAPLHVPPAARERCVFAPTSRPRVAVHAGDPETLRSYPADLTAELIEALRRADWEVVLIGRRRPGELPTVYQRPTSATRCGSQRGHVRDLIGITSGVADLAAVIEAVDVVVTGDSFPLHLAGALGAATVALFAPTDAVIADDYPTVRALVCEAACSPCRMATGVCPLGHGECIAHRDASMSPGRIVELVESSVRPACHATGAPDPA